MGYPHLPQMDKIEDAPAHMTPEGPRVLEAIVTLSEDARVERLKKIETIYREAYERAKKEQNAYLSICGALETESKRLLTIARDLRMALGSEMAQIAGMVKDLRLLVSEKSARDEIVELEKFIALAERLRALKESGFLDAIADTILRLNEAKQ